METKGFVQKDISDGDGNSFVLELRTDDPSSPVEGRIWLRTDLV